MINNVIRQLEEVERLDRQWHLDQMRILAEFEAALDLLRQGLLEDEVSFSLGLSEGTPSGPESNSVSR